MDENNNYENHEHHHHYDDCWLCHHPVLKHILTALMVFLGAYLAFYTVTDWHFKRMMDPAVQMRRFEKNMMREHKQMERMYRKNLERGMRIGEENQEKALLSCVEGIMTGNYLTTTGSAPEDDIQMVKNLNKKIVF